MFLGFAISCGNGQKETVSPLDMCISLTNFDAQADIRKGDIHLIKYGLTIPVPGLDSLTKKYGFYYQNRGCIVNHDTLFKLADAYNEQVIEYLSKRNGEGWFKKFGLIVDSLDYAAIKSRGQ